MKHFFSYILVTLSPFSSFFHQLVRGLLKWRIYLRFIVCAASTHGPREDFLNLPVGTVESWAPQDDFWADSFSKAIGFPKPLIPAPARLTLLTRTSTPSLSPRSHHFSAKPRDQKQIHICFLATRHCCYLPGTIYANWSGVAMLSPQSLLKWSYVWD